jgi:Caspase domain
MSFHPEPPLAPTPVVARRTSRDLDAAVIVPAPPRDTDFGLVVGVDHYPRFRSLQGAVADARRFHTWLCDPDGGNVAPEHARLVVSAAEPASPMQLEIDQPLLELMTAADAIGGGRRLYFHFSGHGAGSPDDAGEDVALLLAAWSRNLARLALSANQYRGTLDVIGLFEEIVISLDCCRTTSERAIGMPPTITLEPRSQRCATRTFIAYATEPGRPAFEVPDHQLWQGVFTRSLLAILRRSPHGISAAALKRELEYEVATHGQRAHVVNGLLDDSRFGRRGILPMLRIAFVHATGQVILRDGNRKLVGTRVAGCEPWELPREAGLYKLEDATGRTLAFDHGEQEMTHVAF